MKVFLREVTLHMSSGTKKRYMVKNKAETPMDSAIQLHRDMKHLISTDQTGPLELYVYKDKKIDWNITYILNPATRNEFKETLETLEDFILIDVYKKQEIIGYSIDRAYLVFECKG